MKLQRDLLLTDNWSVCTDHIIMFQAPTEVGPHGPRGPHVQRIVASRGRGRVMTQLRVMEATSASASMRIVRSAPRTRAQPPGELVLIKENEKEGETISGIELVFSYLLRSQHRQICFLSAVTYPIMLPGPCG